MINAVISGYGHALPAKVVDNKEIVSMMNTTESFIEKRTGVQSRRFVSETESTSMLMVNACYDAITSANLSPSEIDLLLVSTFSPDYHDPSQACLIQPLIYLRDCVPVLDIRAQCSGMIYGMTIAEQFIKTGKYKNILLCCGEVLSKRMDCSDDGRNLSILLGDGAGALVISATDQKNIGILDSRIFADGNKFQLLWTESPGTASHNFTDHPKEEGYFRMKGKAMFRHAVEKLTEVICHTLEHCQLTMKDIDVIIPHQPNLRILDALIDRLDIPIHKVKINVQKYGNIASASLPITLSEYMTDTTVEERSNSLALFVGYGSGATWGSILYKF